MKRIVIRDEIVNHDLNCNPKNQLLVFDGKQVKTITFQGEKEKGTILNSYNEYTMIKNKPINNAYSAPFKIYLDITSACNLGCLHCLNGHTKKPVSRLSLVDIRKIQRYCEEWGVFFVKIGGGEPLLHPQIKDILDILSSSFTLVSMTSNATYYDDSIYSNILKNKIKFSVSMDGERDVHNHIRQSSDAYDKLTTNVEKMLAIGLKPSIKYCVNQYNCDVHSLDAVIQYAREREMIVELKLMKPIRDCNYLMDNLTPRRVKEIITHGQQFDNVRVDRVFDQYHTGELLKTLCAGKDCRAGTRSMHINYFGEVRPCTFIEDTYFKKICNMKTTALNEIWEHDQNMITFRNQDVPQQCKACENDCKAVCYAYRVYNGSLLADNDTCTKAWVQE